MRLLLDTHALLWWMHEPARLSQDALDAMSDPGNDIYVSAVAAMEIATKSRLGKLAYRTSLSARFVEETDAAGFRQLALTAEQAQHAGNLTIPHKDPWDRLLIAQAQVDELLLVTKDAKVRRACRQTFW